MKNKLRKINVDGSIYLWLKSPYLAEEEKLTVFLDGHKKSALRMTFKGTDDWHWGLESGVFFQTRLNGTKDGKDIIEVKSLNLNKPSIVKIFIQHVLKNGWQPELNSKELIIDNGCLLFDEVEFPFEYNESIRDIG